MARLPLTLRLYGAMGAFATPLAPLFLMVRRARGKEDRRRGGERRGKASKPRPKGPLVWLHGASVGETVTILPLAERLIERGCGVLLTSGTVTSASVIGRRLPRGVIHQYMPLDMPSFVRRFLDHWRPNLAIFAESELWPAMLTEAHRRRVPMVLVNARMSRRSFERWRRFPGTIRALLGKLDACLAQSPEDASRFSALDASHVSSPGNLKFDVPPPAADLGQLAAMRGAVAGRPVLIAASTHPGEELIVAAAHRGLRKRFPALLTIIAPRHPERGDALAEELARREHNVVQRSRGFLPDRGTDLYLADTVGELGLLYRLSPIVFVGGTLVDKGGQNPIEAAKLACAVLHGPHVDNFTEAYAALDRADAARLVRDARSLASEAMRLLSEPAEAEAMAEAGRSAVAALSGALDRTMSALDPYLMQMALERR